MDSTYKDTYFIFIISLTLIFQGPPAGCTGIQVQKCLAAEFKGAL